MRLFGIAKHAPMRNATLQLPKQSQVMLWVLDSAEEVVAACAEGARYVVTNTPTIMQRQAASIAQQCRLARHRGG